MSILITYLEGGTEVEKYLSEFLRFIFLEYFQFHLKFVSWKYNPASSNKKSKNSNSTNISETKPTEAFNESTKELSSHGKTYLRFYHVFESQELENLFESIENVSIIESYYEQGNWCAIFEKLS